MKGYTLVELIIVIILIGVLAVAIGPALFSRQGFSEFVFGDRLVFLLQTMQLQAMNQASECSVVVLQAMRFGVPDPCSSMTLPNVFDPSFLGISLSESQDANLLINSPITDVTFDFLGRPIDPQTSTAICQSGCTIQITGEITVSVRIESQGYVHIL